MNMQSLLEFINVNNYWELTETSININITELKNRITGAPYMA